MDPDEKVSTGGGREPEPLRPILDQWKVPEPPREIEWQLRRTFRQQRRAGQRRRQAWVAVAASLALLAVFLSRRSQHATPRPVAIVVPRSAPIAPMRATAEPPPVEVPAALPPPRVTPRARAGRPAGPEIIVEPGQAELLWQLARRLRGTRQAPPGLSLPRIEVVGAVAPAIVIPEARTETLPAHRTDWGTFGDQWPPMHRPI
ncbi:MAG: hypothetical protein DMF79_13445 [Acidobacteria bacterium]|nr:MAG: hypothetical protein DMF79_13445 [Acidobacteriota bacterium]